MGSSITLGDLRSLDERDAPSKLEIVNAAVRRSFNLPQATWRMVDAGGYPVISPIHGDPHDTPPRAPSTQQTLAAIRKPDDLARRMYPDQVDAVILYRDSENMEILRKAVGERDATITALREANAKLQDEIVDLRAMLSPTPAPREPSSLGMILARKGDVVIGLPLP